MVKRTIVAIAERVGVSPATVSRALNNQPGVSPTKRAQILEVAAELDYHPNAIARILQGRRTNTVAYVAEMSNRSSADLFFFKNFITALAERCAASGMDLLIHPAAGDDARMGGVASILRSGRADGLILADIRHGDARVRYLCEQQLPFVTFGRSDSGHDHAYVDVDGAWGVCAATRHLIERGHRRIAFLGLPTIHCCATDRREGYLQAMRARDLPLDPALAAEDLANETQARAAMERLLALPDPPTAFVAASDMLAVHAMGIAAQRGLRAGRDYAITGFDDLTLAEHTDPPLTTLRQPLERICDELIAILARIMAQKDGARRELVRPDLIVRGSS